MFLDVYIDESSQTQCRFLLLGGIVIPSDGAQGATDCLLQRRLPELPRGEMKWGKVSKSKLPAYLRVVDSFFDDAAFASAHFHSIVVDTTRQDHRTFNAGSADVGFNKEIYQIATKCARIYPADYFHVYPDYRDTKQRPEDLRTILNMGRRKAGDTRDWPFRRCHFRDSKTSPLLWVADLFIGAIGFHINGHKDRDGASPARTDLSNHILRRARVLNPHWDTAKSGKFTIWHRQLR